MNETYLVTGAAGFIGYNLCKRLIQANIRVVGLDNLNEYYDVNLKFGRLKDLGISADNHGFDSDCTSSIYPNFTFIKCDLNNRAGLERIFKDYKITHVCNLAAQAGVRYSLKNPHAYIDSNVAGFMNVLENCRYSEVKNLVYASTSSVYGLNTKMPLSEHDSTEHPITLYAATKKANEMMAHSYSHLFRIPTTGLRFFTVYGPWGRPDMALFLFTKAILNDEPINVFNHGDMVRDFTYVDDIVEGIYQCLLKPAEPNTNWIDQSKPDPSTSTAPYRIFNIGNSNPVSVTRYIDIIEEILGKKAIRNMLPIQPGDVAYTLADITELSKTTEYVPKVKVEEGIKKFLDWYLLFYKLK